MSISLMQDQYTQDMTESKILQKGYRSTEGFCDVRAHSHKRSQIVYKKITRFTGDLKSIEQTKTEGRSKNTLCKTESNAKK